MIGLTPQVLNQRGFTKAFWQNAAGGNAGSGPFRPEFAPYDPAIAADNAERARRYHLRYGDVPVRGIDGATDNFHPAGAQVEIREVVLPRAMRNAWAAGWFESYLGVPRSAGSSGWPTDTERDDFAFCVLPSLGGQGWIDQFKTAPGDSMTPLPPPHPVPQGLAAMRKPWRHRLWLELTDTGIQGWPDLMAEQVLPKLETVVEAPGYNQMDSSQGEEVSVPASVFGPMFAAWVRAGRPASWSLEPSSGAPVPG
jgi:hypothetical protein